MHESEKWKGSRSVVSDSSRPHGLQPTRLLRPWDFPGKSTAVGCRRLLRILWRQTLKHDFTFPMSFPLFSWAFILHSSADSDRKIKNENLHRYCRVHKASEGTVRGKRKTKTVIWHLIVRKFCFSSKIFFKFSKKNYFQEEITKITLRSVNNKGACCNVNWTILWREWS